MSTTDTPHKSGTQRLLYRGALSLPDSHLLLDGLTFVIELPVDDPQASRTLLETPLPLALESMRGRQSLAFVGVEKMEDMHCDFGGRVSLHIHPRCILTHQLFAHNLCVEPVSPSKGFTDLGIRIRIGESNSAAVNSDDIVVYGRPHPSSSVMQLCVARVVPPPLPASPPKPVAQLRRPRPDDPTPRKPAAYFGGIARIGLGMKMSFGTSGNAKGNGKEKNKDEPDEGGPKKRQKKEKDAAPDSLRDLGKNTRVGVKNDAGSFKLPPLPPARDKAKALSVAVANDIFDVATGVEAGASDLEARNKMHIKKATVRLMNAAGIGKQHPDFKEFFNHVYRGVMFALRAKMKTLNLEADQKEVELVDRIAQMHVTMYLGGQGLGVYLLQ